MLAVLAMVGCSGQLGVGVGAATPVARPAPSPAPAAQVSASAQIHVEFYGVPLGGANDLVFVLDRSGSMSGSKMDEAKRELLQAIDGLPDATRVGLVFFNSHVDAWTMASVVGAEVRDRTGGGFLPGMVAAGVTISSGNDRKLVALSPVYRRQAHKFVDGIRARGNTAAVPALRAASRMGARHIVFLSDGLANRGGSTEELRQLARELGGRGVRIDTIGLGHDQDYSALGEMAEATGGTAVVH
jgi:hypothetical protein